jgi:hypothetical protein
VTGGHDVDGPGRGIWLAWGLALVGGVAVLAAALLVGRVDLAAACGPGSACTRALSPLSTTLALGGTAAAITGGTAATLLTVRRFGRSADELARRD